MDDFIALLEKSPPITARQQANLRKIIRISEKFHRDAGIPQPPKAGAEIAADTIVLESGHQPNFLPHAGVFKKAFLIDYIKRALEARGRRCIAVFGFADYNLATASLLYKNRVPALSRTGFHKVGFQPRKEDKWKAFSRVAKPKENDFSAELKIMHDFYENSAMMARFPEEEIKQNLQKLEDLMRDAYAKAKNFPDMNAFMIARICQSLGVRVRFFRYTDMQQERVLINECKDVIERLPEFNRAYMESIRKEKVDINYSEDSIPFWLTCGCGGITELSGSPGSCSGKCASCGKEHSIDLAKDLERSFPQMSMNAVARNVIVASGLGCALYVSGSGGGLEYGKVSDRITDTLHLRKPVTLAWKGTDLRFGMLHFLVLRDFIKSLHLGMELSDEPGRLPGSAKAIIAKSQGAKKENMERKAAAAAVAFSVSPSIADFMVFGNAGKDMAGSWEESLMKAPILREGAFYIAKSDTIHEGKVFPGVPRTENIQAVFRAMSMMASTAPEPQTEEE